MQFSHFALAALPLASSASAVTYFNDEKVPLIETRDSLDKRLTIAEKVAIISAGGASINAVRAVAEYVSVIIKTQSDRNTCGTITGNVDGVNYQYHAATTGKKCDTTAQLKTINDAVTKGLNWMNKNNVNQACFDMMHKGTWKGKLQIASGGMTIINGKCDDMTPNIDV